MTYVMSEEEHSLMHYGILRKSGRYPWGSGGNPAQRSRTFLDMYAEAKAQGLTDQEIAKGFFGEDGTTTKLRDLKTIARNMKKQADIAEIERLSAKGMSNVAIGTKMGIPESTVRALRAPGQKEAAEEFHAIANVLKKNVDEKGYIQVGTGVEGQMSISRKKLDTGIALLKDQGYQVINVQVPQLGTSNLTTIKVLAPPGTSYLDVKKNILDIKSVGEFSDDGGRTFLGIQPPIQVNSKRIAVRFEEDGGADADGVIYVRPGVSDLSMGQARYAQVRIAVDGTHYIKGMALYKDDLPPGVDLVVNTPKSRSVGKLGAMKEIKSDPDNPFGSAVRQIIKLDKDGKEKVTSAMNLVNEEGDWEKWSKNLSSQMLSKQKPSLAKQQLDEKHRRETEALDEIMKLTNPEVRRKLLESYADSADSAAVHLKAAALPRQGTHVILPINSLRDDQIYAPNYNNGDRVVLIRYPHGGIFEIPELTVNNNHRAAKKALGDARDAVGINSKVAERLSGADFDGDTVLVIPNNNKGIKSMPSLEGLMNFDAKKRYAPYDGMPTMDGGTYNAKTGKAEFPEGKKPNSRTKQREMGVVSNLITDMTIGGASPHELAAAVRHSMVVIDAEKHHLNYKQSAIDNGIAHLKAKYQGGPRAGASTLISRAGAQQPVPKRKLQPASKGGSIDKKTGEKLYEITAQPYTVTRTNKRTGVVTEVTKIPTQQSKRLAETKDARTLIGHKNTVIEQIYADYSNKMKGLANQARLESTRIKSDPYSPSARTAYSKEVASLNSKLAEAIKNRPLERQAQVIGNLIYQQKRNDNPDMDRAEEKKLKGLAITEARRRTGATKQQIQITPEEWAAIQAGAISPSKLRDILNNADLDVVKQLATPKVQIVMNSAKQAQARALAAKGATQAEIADALGVSLTTLKRSLNPE